MLKREELKQINGGFNITTGIIIGTVVTFLIGLFDGYTRPLACR